MTTTTRAPFKLQPEFVQRVWGKTDLRPWYDCHGGEPVGEAWLTGEGCLTESGERFADVMPGHPLLVKMLFPSEKLSVQVHPNDAEARALGLDRGKTECWYVLAAEPDAKVACGLRDGVSVEDFSRAVRDGRAEETLLWLPVKAGDMVYVDAGTVHAIGPGVVLLETQQTCDVTYRLYDYGRPRELHLEQGLAVMKTGTAAGFVSAREMDGFVRLIESDFFVVDRYAGEAAIGPGCVLGLRGEVRAGNVTAEAGVAVVCGDEAVVRGEDWVRCWVPENLS